MRGGRLITLMLLLQARGRMTARELAAELEVSLSTIHRDIDELSAAGIPIYAERGARGGIRLLDRPVETPALASDEAIALLVTAQPVVAADLGFSDAAQRARLKLEQALPADERHSLRQLQSLVHVDTGPRVDRADTACLQAFVAAAHRCHAVRLFVTSRPAVVVRPLGVVHDGSGWWVAGELDGILVAFPIAAITRLEGTNEAFARPTGFDLATAWQQLHTASESGE